MVKDMTLVVVDMQEGFPTAHLKRTIEECKKLIKYFIARDLPIIVLEYEGYYEYGETLACLRKLYANYPYVKILRKRKNDGSNQVHKFFKREHWGMTNNDEIVICGVNIACCVQETTWGLLRKGYKVRAVKKACNCESYRGGARIWKEYYPLSLESVRIPHNKKYVGKFHLVEKTIDLGKR